VPISSVIEIQYAMAPGTALVQKRRGGDAITIVTGGEAGTAEGDFASCLVWSTRPGHELPVLMIVTNNGWGISTAACTQHGERSVKERGRPFGIPGEVIDGNDPIASWHAIRRAMAFCRLERRPYLLEAVVSRLYGHSSSSGALRVKDELDCVELFEDKLLAAGVLDRETLEQTHEDAAAEAERALEQALEEPPPTIDDIHRDTYAPSPVDKVFPEDYTGLPK
jgi:2-oxoisovalerate dehydrogenase E1 component alpha subunit